MLFANSTVSSLFFFLGASSVNVGKLDPPNKCIAQSSLRGGGGGGGTRSSNDAYYFLMRIVKDTSYSRL